MRHGEHTRIGHADRDAGESRSEALPGARSEYRLLNSS